MEWTETKETTDKYRTFKEPSDRFTIVDKPNAFEMVCYTKIGGLCVLTTYRDVSLDKLQKLAILLSDISA